MGKEVVSELEEMLGLGEETQTKEEPSTKEPTAPEPQAETNTKPQTTTVTQEQLDINKEIAKVDMQIEALGSTSAVDINLFYDNLEEHLSEEEQQLEFSDKSAYMKLVAKKANEFSANNSKQTELVQLQEQKKELEGVYARQSAILDVVQKYPSYNHQKVLEFYTNKLSKFEQDEILSASSSYADVYEKTYQKFLNLNPVNIASQSAPNLPNLNDVRRQDVKNKDILSALSNDNEKLKAALGV